MDSTDTPLERGLSYYFENLTEFDRKEVPEEKRVAIAFEAGRQLGRCEVKDKVSRVFKTGPEEWA